MRLWSKGSKAKSMTPVPLIRTGVTPSGILPGFEVSNTATLPPGPVSGKAMRSGFAKGSLGLILGFL